MKINLSIAKASAVKIIFLILTFTYISYSQDSTMSVIDVNNITSWVDNRGFHPTVVTAGDLAGKDWNGTFPKGTAGGVYTEGIAWGGKVFDGNNPLVRVNGSTYISGNSPLTRVYRVMPFYDQIDLHGAAASFFRVPIDSVTDSMVSKVYDSYKKDWNEWPAGKGAPYYDKNKDGKYEPDIDIPGIPGASQTIWIDYDDSRSLDTYASPPIGLEVQETYWAYAHDERLNDIIFHNVKIIYRGLSTSAADSHIDSMYIVNFSDIDDGAYYDDYIGCDTALNMGYIYNSKNADDIYKKYFPAPPAIGYTFLHGVAERTGSPSDQAIVNFKLQKGYKYFNSKPLTVYIAHRTGGTFADPFFNNYYYGTLSFYNFMRGYSPRPPYPAIRPFSGLYGPMGGYGTYMLSGDPVTGTGWIDGILEGAGDRRMWMVTGPFNLRIGDTAEVSLALAGGIGTDYLKSILILRYNIKLATLVFNLFVDNMTSGGEFDYTPPPSQPRVLPEHYLLSQNYPNPFNPTTTIKYELPKAAYVRLVVYDILGREVKVLVDEQKEAGSYTVRFDGSDLPSGVYFYRITFTNSDSKLVNDNLSKVNKLMLIK